MPPFPDNLAAAHRKLARLNARIAAHPLNSARFARALEVSAEHASHGRQQMEDALRAENLPGWLRQMRMLAFDSIGLARLNRRRIRLEHTIARLEAGRPVDE